MLHKISEPFIQKFFELSKSFGGVLWFAYFILYNITRISRDNFIMVYCCKFLQSKVLFVFGVLLVPFWNIRNFLRVDYFYFWIWESYFLKYKRNITQGSFIFRNIRKLRFSKYKKVDYNISYKLLRPSQFLEKFIEILK